MKKDVIIACDFDGKEKLFEFLDKLGDEKPYLKIGMELFYSEGAPLIRELKSKGYKIFLDLKLCDIPNTVKKALMVLKDLDVDFINLHTFGGIKMMEEAASVFAGTNTKVVAVTVLTSIDNETLKNELLINETLNGTVAHYAYNAKTANLSGVICSPLEVKGIKGLCGVDFITITPGIRFESDNVNDQVRVTTPAMARELGSDYIVVGRSITVSDNPLASYQRCVSEFLGGENE